MKPRLMLAAILGIAAFTTLSCGPGADSPGAAAGLTPTAFKSATLANGAAVVVHPGTPQSGPMVAIAVRLDAGPMEEGVEEAGYSSLLGRLFSRTGEGTVSALMASVGSTLSVDVQPDGLYLTALVLAEDAAAAAGAIATLVNVAPETVIVEETRAALIADLERAQQAGGFAVRDAINGALYPDIALGADTAARLAALSAATPEKFLAWREKVLRPERIQYALVGALNQEIIESLCRVAASPATGDVAQEQVGAEESAEEGEGEPAHVPIRLLDRPGSENANLYLMRRLPAIPAEDYYPLQAVNQIFNGQSTFARLTALQVANRLPTPITSSLELRTGDSAHLITAQCPVNETGALFAAIMQQIEQLYGGTLLNSRLLEQEIADARNLLKGQLLRQTETPAQLARFMLWARSLGFKELLPGEHLKLVAALDKDRLLAVINTYLVPGLNSLVAVGPADRLRTQLSPFGETSIQN